jgi:hypothetical protein
MFGLFYWVGIGGVFCCGDSLRKSHVSFPLPFVVVVLQPLGLEGLPDHRRQCERRHGRREEKLWAALSAQYNYDKDFVDVGNGSAVIRSTYERRSLETSYGIPCWRLRTFHPQGCLHNEWSNLLGSLVQLQNRMVSLHGKITVSTIQFANTVLPR